MTTRSKHTADIAVRVVETSDAEARLNRLIEKLKEIRRYEGGINRLANRLGVSPQEVKKAGSAIRSENVAAARETKQHIAKVAKARKEVAAEEAKTLKADTAVAKTKAISAQKRLKEVRASRAAELKASEEEKQRVASNNRARLSAERKAQHLAGYAQRAANYAAAHPAAPQGHPAIRAMEARGGSRSSAGPSRKDLRAGTATFRPPTAAARRKSFAGVAARAAEVAAGSLRYESRPHWSDPDPVHVDERAPDRGPQELVRKPWVARPFVPLQAPAPNSVRDVFTAESARTERDTLMSGLKREREIASSADSRGRPTAWSKLGQLDSYADQQKAGRKEAAAAKRLADAEEKLAKVLEDRAEATLKDFLGKPGKRKKENSADVDAFLASPSMRSAIAAESGGGLLDMFNAAEDSRAESRFGSFDLQGFADAKAARRASIGRAIGGVGIMAGGIAGGLAMAASGSPGGMVAGAGAMLAGGAVGGGRVLSGIAGAAKGATRGIGKYINKMSDMAAAAGEMFGGIPGIEQIGRATGSLIAGGAAIGSVAITQRNAILEDNRKREHGEVLLGAYGMGQTYSQDNTSSVRVRNAIRSTFGMKKIPTGPGYYDMMASLHGLAPDAALQMGNAFGAGTGMRGMLDFPTAGRMGRLATQYGTGAGAQGAMVGALSRRGGAGSGALSGRKSLDSLGSFMAGNNLMGNAAAGAAGGFFNSMAGRGLTVDEDNYWNSVGGISKAARHRSGQGLGAMRIHAGATATGLGAGQGIKGMFGGVLDAVLMGRAFSDPKSGGDPAKALGLIEQWGSNGRWVAEAKSGGASDMIMQLALGGKGLSQKDAAAYLGRGGGAYTGDIGPTVTPGLAKSKASARADVSTAATGQGGGADAQYAEIVKISNAVRQAVASLASHDSLIMDALRGMSQVAELIRRLP